MELRYEKVLEFPLFLAFTEFVLPNTAFGLRYILLDQIVNNVNIFFTLKQYKIAKLA